MSLHPNSAAFRTARALVTSGVIGWAAAGLCAPGAQAQTVGFAPQAISTPAAGKLNPLHCKGAFGILDDVLSNGIKATYTMTDSLLSWQEAGCPYPYYVKWENQADRTKFNTVRGQMLGTSKSMPPISLDQLGIRLAPAPTIPAVGRIKPTASLESVRNPN